MDCRRICRFLGIVKKWKPYPSENYVKIPARAIVLVFCQEYHTWNFKGPGVIEAGTKLLYFHSKCYIGIVILSHVWPGYLIQIQFK